MKCPSQEVLLYYKINVTARVLSLSVSLSLNVLSFTTHTMQEAFDASKQASSVRFEVILIVAIRMIKQSPFFGFEASFINEHHYVYSETCLKRTCSKADTYLKRTKYFDPKYQFTGQSLINTTCLKRTPVQSGQKYWSQRCPLQTGFTVEIMYNSGKVRN